MKNDINRLVLNEPASPGLDAPVNPPAIREKTGLEREQTGKIKTEEITVTSTDGLFTFIVRVAKS